MYLYRRVNQFEFSDDFRRIGWPRRFSQQARLEIYLYLQAVAESTKQPIEIDYAELIGRFREYRRVADALADHYPPDEYDILSRWWCGDLSIDEAQSLLEDRMTVVTFNVDEEGNGLIVVTDLWQSGKK